MDHDHSHSRHALFIIGLIALVLSLVFLGITLYMLPHLLFGLKYDTPEIFMVWMAWLQDHHGYTLIGASRLILLLFFLFTALFILVAYLFSNRIDNQLLNSGLAGKNRTTNFFGKNSREGLYLAFKILLIMIGIFIAASFLQWLIYYM